MERIRQTRLFVMTIALLLGLLPASGAEQTRTVSGYHDHGKAHLSRICKFRDALLPVLQEASEADGLAIASPIYMADRTALTQASYT